jgi:hypothetical protein
MKVCVISDTHDHKENLLKAIKIAKEKDVSMVIHCGDYCAPFMVKIMEGFEVEAHGVFGNVDGDKFRMLLSLPKNFKLHGEFAEIEISGKKIGIVHFPELAEAMAKSEKYDVVFHGHTHERRLERLGKCLLINPGELMNLKGNPSLAIYDPETNDVEFIEV